MALVEYNTALLIFIVNKDETLTKGCAQTSLLQADGRDTSTGTTVTDGNFFSA